MKVKFTKLAALLLAGAALFVAGCTDYEVDIQNVDKKVDELAAKTVADLNSQVAALNATISQLETKLSGDIQGVRADLTTLTNLHNNLQSNFDTYVSSTNETIKNLQAADATFTQQIADLSTKYQNLQDNKADKTELAQVKADLLAAVAGEEARAKAKEAEIEAAVKEINEVTIPAIKAQIKNIEEVVIPAMKQDIQDLKDGKVDKVDFEAYKTETAKTIENMKKAIGDLSELNTENKDSLVKAVNEVLAKFDDYVLTTTFEAFVEVAATKEELELAKVALNGRIDALKALIGEFPEDTTVKEYIDAKVLDLQGQIDDINDAIEELDKRVTKLETTVYETVIPQIQFALDYEGYYSYKDGLEGYIQDWAFDAYYSAIDYVDYYLDIVWFLLDDIYNRVYELFDILLSRVQSVVYVPDYDDQKMTMNLVYYTDYAGHFLVIGKETEVTYKVNPADAFKDKAALAALVEKGALDFDVVPVKTRASESETNDPKLDIVGVKDYNPETGKFTLIVRPNNVVSSAFADYQIDPYAMYFARLQASQENGEMQLVQNEDGTYQVINIPFGPEFSGFQDEDDVFMGWETIVDQEAYGEWVQSSWWEYFMTGRAYHYEYHPAVTHQEPKFETYVWYAYSAEELAAYKEAIEELEKALNDYVQDDVEKYNELVEKYNAAIDAYNKALDKYMESLQRRGSARNYAAALNVYLNTTYTLSDTAHDEYAEAQVTNISSTYTTFYPSKYAESEHIVINRNPYVKLEELDAKKQDVKAYEDYIQELEFNSKETKEILPAAIPAVTIYDANFENARTISYDLARAEGYMVIDPTWSNAYISYMPAFGEEKYFVVNNEFEDKVPPYATVRMNYLDGDKGYANSTLKGRVGDFVFGAYVLEDNMFGSNWAWLGAVKVVPPTAKIDLYLEKPITWTYANDADVDHNRFYKEEGNTEYFRNDLVVKIDTDLEEVAEKFGITPADLQGLYPTSENRMIVKYDVVETNAAGKSEAYEVRVSFDGFGPNAQPIYTRYEDGEATEKPALKIGHVDLDPKTGALDMNVTNFEWDKTYTVNAKYYYVDHFFGSVSVIVDVNFVFNTVDRSRKAVTLPVQDVTFAINGSAYQKNDGAGWYKWVGTSQQEAIKKAFVEGGVITDLDFKTVAAFATAELVEKIHDQVSNKANDLYTYVDVSQDKQISSTTELFTPAMLQHFAKKDAKGNFVQDPENPYKFLGDLAYRYITTYIGEEVILPFTFNWTVPAYDYEALPNQTKQDAEGTWFSFAAPKYIDSRETLTLYDVTYMNVPALAFNIVDANGKYFNWKDKENAGDFFYDANLISSFFYTDPTFGAKSLEKQNITDELKVYEDLWSSDEKVNFEHSVFYYRSTLDAIPMFGKLELVSGNARFEIPTSFGNPYNGVKLAETPYSNYELRAWKPFVVDTYKQEIFLDLSNPGTYTIDLLKGIQFYDARQVAQSTPSSSTIREVNGVQCWVRPMMNLQAGTWVVGNGTAANGYAQGVTSAQAYEIAVQDFEWDSISAVPAKYRGLINVIEDKETYTYKMEFDYNSEISFNDTVSIPFTFQLLTKWQKLEPFEVTVTVRGLNAQ